MKHLLTILCIHAAVSASLVQVSTPSQYQNAIANASAGDTILLAAGTYPDVQAPQNAHGTITSPIVVKAETKGTVAFDSYSEGLKHYPKHWIYEGIHFKGNTSNHLFHIKPGSHGYLTIRNCHFSGCQDKAIKIDFAAYSGLADFWPDYILVEGCTMEVGQAGLMNNDGADYCTVRDNYTYGFVDGGVGYIYFNKGGMAYCVIENNLVDGARWGPISHGGGSMSGPFTKLKHDDDLASAHPNKSIEAVNCIIRNNIVLNADYGSHTSTTLNCEIYNNTFINCGGSLEIHPHHGNPIGLKFYNNLMINTGGIHNGGTFVDTAHNISLTSNPAEIFANYNSQNVDSSDFKLKAAAQNLVTSGQSINDHSRWNLHGLPSSQFYDYYGTQRPTIPTIGATEFEGVPIRYSANKSRSAIQGLVASAYTQNASMYVSITLSTQQPLIDIVLINMLGKRVKTLYYGPMHSGDSQLRFTTKDHDGNLLPCGQYVIRISSRTGSAYLPVGIY